MARKAVVSGGKREELVDAARKLFLARGYEATSVRAILEEVHGEVGMFYHYFKSKDEIFDAAVDRWLADFSARVQATDLASGPLPGRWAALMGLLDDALRAAGGPLHWSIAPALRERALALLIPAAEALAEAALEEGGQLPGGADATDAAAFLLHGAAGILSGGASSPAELAEKQALAARFAARALRLPAGALLPPAVQEKPQPQGTLPSWLL